MNLNDLSNPNNIIAVLEYRTNKYIEASEDQRFQELPKRIELWQMFEGKLWKVKGWNKTSVAMYS